MIKAKDFFGKDITDVIEQACKAFDTTQDNLDIEVLETGSAGIFGLCRKQAHIRVNVKEPAPNAAADSIAADGDDGGKRAEESKAEQTAAAASSVQATQKAEAETPKQDKVALRAERTAEKEEKQAVDQSTEKPAEMPPPRKEEIYEEPSTEALEAIKDTLEKMLVLMHFPSKVDVVFSGNTVCCTISSEHEEQIIGTEGRTLDSMQYLLRKMMLQHLPDKFLLSLNAGDFRERRAEELKQRALDLAEMVKEDGKTQAIPALNPSERRIVHMILQEDKSIRSRSVGDGLFKKVLIYKPGKGKRHSSRRKRG